MKRKILFVLLLGVLVLGLTGCGENKATIIDNNGNKVEMTSKDLVEVNKENNSKFETKYFLSDIDLTSTIQKVEAEGSYTCGSNSKFFYGDPYDLIYLSDGWTLCVRNYDLAKLDKDMKIRVKGVIVGIEGTNITVSGKSDKKTAIRPNEIDIEFLD